MSLILSVVINDTISEMETAQPQLTGQCLYGWEIGPTLLPYGPTRSSEIVNTSCYTWLIPQDK